MFFRRKKKEKKKKKERKEGNFFFKIASTLIVILLPRLIAGRLQISRVIYNRNEPESHHFLFAICYSDNEKYSTVYAFVILHLDGSFFFFRGNLSYAYIDLYQHRYR